MRHEPAPTIQTLRVCSLFSGIGGFELGLQAAGHTTILMCESDPCAQKVLRRRFPEVELASDITQLTSLPECDLLTAGWPCQDLSLAGGTAGHTGTRSGLVAEVFRLIAASERKPQFVLLENVAFSLDLHGGRAVSYVIERLEALGYRWAYRVLDSRAFGLPQRRRRLFILAALEGDPGAILLDGIASDSLPTPLEPKLVGFYWTEGNRGLGWSPEAVPPLKGGSGVGIPSPPAVWNRTTACFISPGIDDAERLQGFPVDWTIDSASLPRGDRRRWVLVGNAVSTPVAEWIGRRLGGVTSCRLHENLVSCGREGRMPRAAEGGGGRPLQGFEVTREGPTIAAVTELGEFGINSPRDVSHRAIAGFTQRYQSSSLRKNKDFLAALIKWKKSEV